VRARLAEWRAVGASEKVQSWIRRGAPIGWRSRKRPPKFNLGESCARDTLTPAQQEFLDKEIRRCVDKVGSWEKAECLDFVSKAFLVPKPGVANKWRLVVDLRPINKFCKKCPMRSETLASLRHLARKNDYMFTFDLQDGYNAVGVAPEDRKYMTFNIQGTYYQAAAVPFGWNQSAYVFCETVRVWVAWMRAPPLVETSEGRAAAALAEQAPAGSWQRQRGKLPADERRRTAEETRLRWKDLQPGARRLRATTLRPARSLRGRGVRLLWYVDDVLVLGRTMEEALETRAYVESTLARLGLQRNPNKGMWEPAMRTKHLGLDVDTKEGTFCLTVERQAKLKRLAKGLGTMAARDQRWVPARELASLVGLAQSAHLAVPPARFYLRELYDVLSTKKSWASRVRLSRQALRDLRWWTDVPSKWAARSIWRSPDTAFIHTDASGEIGWGGVLNGLRPTRGFWRDSQKPLHITLKELKAVRFTVETFVRDLAGKRVLLWEDNQAVVAVLTNVTSRSPALMTELRKLWWILDTNDIALRARYIRSAANVWADKLSRDRDGQGDWMLDPELFGELSKLWGEHTIDRFATTNNSQLARFNALMEMPGCEAVDSMSLTDDVWRRERNWCNPPWALLPMLAAKLRTSGAAATVIAPTWRSAPWFRELLDLCDEARIEPARHGLFRPGDQGSRRAVGPAGWSVTAFRIPLRPKTR
jgi:hypothetical protein